MSNVRWTRWLLNMVCENEEDLKPGEVDIWDRLSAAGVEYERTEAQNATLLRIMQSLNGRVGIVTDKSVQLIFPSKAAAMQMGQAIKSMRGDFEWGDKVRSRW